MADLMYLWIDRCEWVDMDILSDCDDDDWSEVNLTS